MGGIFNSMGGSKFQKRCMGGVTVWHTGVQSVNSSLVVGEGCFQLNEGLDRRITPVLDENKLKSPDTYKRTKFHFYSYVSAKWLYLLIDLSSIFVT